MPITKKSLLPRNLANYDVWIEDTSPSSPYFQVTNLPPKFAGGRNSFLIAGSTLLQNKSKILIEILDSRGNPIYQTTVRNFTEANSKMISLEIYDSTPVGFATIIIMGKATVAADGSPIPAKWASNYNVRWTRKILTDYYADNTSPIRFENQPEVLVEEVRFKNIYNPAYIQYDVNVPVKLSPILYSSVQTGYGLYVQSPATFSSDHFNAVFTGSLQINDKVYDISLPVNSILNSSKATSENYLIGTSESYVKDMVLLQSGSYQTLVNNQLATITSSVKLRYFVLNEPVINAPTSFASIRVVNMSTVSGEIKKLRIYQTSVTDAGGFKLIGDVPTVSQELLVSSSVRGAVPYGFIYDAPNISDNWYTGNLTQNTGIQVPLYPLSGSSEYYTPTASMWPLSVNNNVLLQSIRADVPLTGSVFSGSVATNGYFIGTIRPIRIFPTTEYTLQFNAFYNTTSGSVSLTGKTPIVDIYIVGNSVIDGNPLGQRIGRIQPSMPIALYERTQFNFTPNISVGTDVSVRFVISNGFWYFSDISLHPAEDIQFSPDETQIVMPNTDYYNQVLQYKVEFFNIDNNSTTITAVSVPTFFTGSVTDLGLLPT